MELKGENLMAYSGDDYCFGCGEKNPIGLHLNFEKVEDKVTAKKILATVFEEVSFR